MPVLPRVCVMSYEYNTVCTHVIHKNSYAYTYLHTHIRVNAFEPPPNGNNNQQQHENVFRFNANVKYIKPTSV